MSEEPEERKLSISTTQVIASALAAMSVAFLTSWLGAKGTILGAFLGSVIATVGTAAYSWSLHRTSAAVKHTAAQVRQTALQSNSLPRTVAQGPLRKGPAASDEAEGQGSGPAETGEQTSVLTPAEQAAAESEVDPDAPTGRWDGFPWKKTLLATGAVLALSILGITVLEVVTGQSMSSLSGNDDSKNTTVGNVLDNSNDQDKAPAPSDKQTSTPEPAGGETQAPSPEPEPSSEPSPSTEPSQTTSPDSQPSSNASEAP